MVKVSICVGSACHMKGAYATTQLFQEALEKAGITDVTNTVMVGDREYDILGAKENGLDSIGVLYGYGSREELEAAGAGQIAETVEELWKILRQNSVTKGNLT